MYDQIAEGDSVLFVPFASNGTRPNRRMSTDEPGLVVRKVDRGHYILVAYRQNSLYLPWGEVADALDNGRSKWELVEQLDDADKATVIDLFADD